MAGHYARGLDRVVIGYSSRGWVMLPSAGRTMIQRHPEPLLWMLFSAGGVLSAMLMPILLFLFGIAFPLGWLAHPTHEQMLAVLTNPLARDSCCSRSACCRCFTGRTASATRSMTGCRSST